MTQKKIQIKLLGAFDRFNYGDLLFPQVIEHALEKQIPGRFEFKCYSLISADFTAVGGPKTHDYRTFRRDINEDDVSHIIVAGGECVSATWDRLYGYINPLFARLYPLVAKITGPNSLAKNILGGSSEYPFCPDKNDFQSQIRVLYNSVGGISLDSVIIDRLRSANYLAVRDSRWGEALIDGPIPDAQIVPDSAIILSDLFPAVTLTDSPIVRDDITSIIKSPYICFQVCNQFSDAELNSAAKQIKSLAEHSGARIVLCPIGTAPGHEDQIALRKVAQALERGATIILRPTVHEIALLLSRTSLFVGTSLHGVISAFSYGRPFVGLTKRASTKVANYIDSWAPDGLRVTKHITDFSSSALSALEFDKQVIRNIADDQKKQYYDSAERMAEIIMTP